MIFLKNMFLRTLACVGLMIFVTAPLQAQEVNESECGPGFVQAECIDDKKKFDDYSTSTGLCGDTTQTNNENGVTATYNDPGCHDLHAAWKACSSQCIPKVTNGGILAGPADGAEARTYLLDNFLPNLTNSFLIFSMIMSVLVLIVSGFMWIFASGNTELVARARDTAIWSIIGLSIGVAAYLLVQIVININFFA